MKRYELRPVGVLDRELGVTITRTHSAWADYDAWVIAGGVPDPMPGPPQPSIEQRRAERAALVNRLRDDRAGTGITFDGHRYDTDPRSRENLAGAVASVGGGGGLPDGFAWRTEDNQLVAMTPQKLAQLGRAVVDHVNACYARSWQLKDTIAASDDPESIDITSGWPT